MGSGQFASDNQEELAMYYRTISELRTLQT